MKTLVILCGVFGLLALAWMAFLPTLVERELRKVTGFDVRIEVLAANPFTGRVSARGVKARNPESYPTEEFVDLRELKTELGVFSCFLGDRLVIESLDVNAASVEIVRRHDGHTNAGDFIGAFSGPSGNAQGGSPSKSGKPFQYLVKSLHVRLDRLVIADYSTSKPEVKTYELGIDHTFSNVTDPKQLLVPDVVRSLYAFGLRRDTEQLLPGEFGRALADAVGAAAHVGSKLKGATQKTGEFFKGVIDKLEQSVKP